MNKPIHKTIMLIIAFSLLFGFAYMVVENTRLAFENTHLEAELVDSRKELHDTQTELVNTQNKAYGYKWQLEQINKDEGWGGDE